MNPIILIDNGHGIDTAGKCSPDKTLREWAWTREVAQLIVEGLTERGYDARRLVTEPTDISLGERARRANAICDANGTKNVLLVSVHCNAAGADGKWKSAGGWCAYTSPGTTKADTLATFLYESAQNRLANYIAGFSTAKANGNYDGKQRPIRTDYSDGDPDYEAKFYILTKTKCPAVLTENLFQDNKADTTYLLSTEGKRTLALAHIEGIIAYIKAQPK